MAVPRFPRSQDAGNLIPVLSHDGANSTVLSSPSGSTTQSVAITATIVRIVASAAVNIEFGTNPTATTTTSLYLPANTVEYFKFTSGDKVAAIGTATVYITPMA